MKQAAPRNPFGAFLFSFAMLIGRMSRCIDDERQRAARSELMFDAVLDRLNRMFIRVQRAIQAYEPGRPNRAPSAACHAAAAAAHATRAAAGEAAPERKRARRLRLPCGFGWLPRFYPDAEAFGPHLREVLNDPALPELIANVPGIRRTMLSLCNMLGVGNFMVQPAQEAALGTYQIGRGWRAPRVSEGRSDTRADARADAAPAPGRRQDE